jgi:hypothetical protein
VNQCRSTFYGAQCDLPTGHDGSHESSTPVDSRSYEVVWTDESADRTAS